MFGQDIHLLPAEICSSSRPFFQLKKGGFLCWAAVFLGVFSSSLTPSEIPPPLQPGRARMGPQDFSQSPEKWLFSLENPPSHPRGLQRTSWWIKPLPTRWFLIINHWNSVLVDISAMEVGGTALAPTSLELYRHLWVHLLPSKFQQMRTQTGQSDLQLILEINAFLVSFLHSQTFFLEPHASPLWDKAALLLIFGWFF